MLKYIPGLAKPGHQGQLHSTEIKRKYVDDSYRNKKSNRIQRSAYCKSLY